MQCDASRECDLEKILVSGLEYFSISRKFFVLRDKKRKYKFRQIMFIFCIYLQKKFKQEEKVNCDLVDLALCKFADIYLFIEFLTWHTTLSHILWRCSGNV